MAGLDFTKGADHLTLDSLTSFLRSNPKGADMAEMSALMEELDAKFKNSPAKMIMGPIMAAQFAPMLDKITNMSNELGDKYGVQMVEDIKAGRIDRLPNLSKLCTLNCFRLSDSKKDGELREILRTYIREEHKADVTNPKDNWLYVPALTSETMIIWQLISALKKAGLVIQHEDLKLNISGEEVEHVTILQICDVV